MEYKKIIIDGYILGVVTVKNGNIGKDEYDQITEIIHSRPTAPDGYAYKLRADTLAWELTELPSDDVLSDTEALDIITGGAI